MNANLILELLTFLTVGGGLYALVTVQDKKTALMLDNIKAMLESSEKTNKAWEELASQKRDDIKKLEERCSRKDDKIDSLYKEISVLRLHLDKARTARAVSDMLKCSTVGCNSRMPPFGSSIPKLNDITLTPENDESKNQ